MPLARRFLLAFLLLLVVAPGARAQSTIPVGTWHAIGTDPSPINHDRDGDALVPSIAALGAKPIIAYQQYFSANVGTAENPNVVGALNIRASRLEGGATQPLPWQDITGTQINKDFAQEAYEPDIAVIEGVPYVAWVEEDGTNDEIRVARWTSSGWEHLGNAASPVNDSPVRDAQGPSITGLGGVPYVAWAERDADDRAKIRVKAWDGTAWDEPAAGPLNVWAGSSGVAPALAAVGGTLFVAWQEHAPEQFRNVIEVKFLSEGQWYRAGDGAAPISEAGPDSLEPSLVGVGNRPYVAWHQNGDVHVKSYDGDAGTWGPVNGQTQIDPEAGDVFTVNASIANVAGVPYVAYARTPGRAELRVRRPQADGTGWEPVGGVLNTTADQDARSSDIVGINGAPVVTWAENDEHPGGGESTPHNPNANVQIYAKAYGIPPISGGAPQLSGVPRTGSQLSCTTGTWNGATSYTILWQRGLRDGSSWKAIDGATGPTYTVQAADEGSRVRCLVIAEGAVVAAERASASLRTDASRPVSLTRPTVKGVPVIHQTLECDPGEWTNSPELRYQWVRGSGPIAGATGRTYTPKRRRQGGVVVNPDGDGDHHIGCRVAGVNDIGSSPDDNGSPLVLVVDEVPINYRAPTNYRADPNGGPMTPMTCTTGDWFGDYGPRKDLGYGYSHQWFRNDSPIAGAVNSNYWPTADDYGRKITCKTQTANPVGSAWSQASNELVVELPKGTIDSSVHQVGGGNQVEPTNLMAISWEYERIISGITKRRMTKGIDDLKAACARDREKYGKTAPVPSTVTAPMTADVQCRIFLYDFGRVVPWAGSGVYYNTGNCVSDAEFASRTRPLCPSFDIQTPAIDPKKPPAQDAELMQALADATPKRILWDIDGDGTTDAACPGSAPVLRTIYSPGRWKPRAVIIDMNDRAAHYAETSFTQAGEGSSREGVQRPTQVKVCATSFEPPPEPSYPCVTEATIGRVQIRDANLCPISERQIQNADFMELIDADTREFLFQVSERKLGAEGAVTASRSPHTIAKTHYVAWEPPKARAAQGPDLRVGGLKLDSDARRLVDAAAANGAAAMSTATFVPPTASGGRLYEPSKDPQYAKVQQFTKDVAGIMGGNRFALQNGQFAIDQIYVSRGESMAINGILNTPLAKTAMLLVPTEVDEAIKYGKHQMAILGRDVATQLGLEGVPNPLPLASEGQLKSLLKEQATGAAEEMLRQTNLDELGESLKRKLDIKPFKLFGESKVTLNKDGTATLKAHVNLPGLTGMKTGGGGKGESIGADITITADRDGRISFDGIQLRADYANLGLIELSNVFLDYRRATGLDVRAKLLMPLPGAPGIDLKQLKISDEGKLDRIWIEFLASAATSIPLGGSGLFLTSAEVDANIQADEYMAGLGIGVGQAVTAGCPAVGIDADLKIRLARPFFIDGNALAKVMCIPLAGMHFRMEESGLISLAGTWDLELGPLWTRGSIGAAFKLPEWQVWLAANGGIRPIIEGKVDVVLGSRGLAGCGSMEIEVPGVSQVSEFFGGDEVKVTIAGGGAVGFVRGRPPTSYDEIVNNVSLFWGCDIGRYYPLGRLATAAQAGGPGSASFTMPSDAGPSLVSVEGAGGAPKIRLKSPSGKVYDLTSTPGNKGKKFAKDAWGAIIEAEDRTVAIFGRPEAGTWTAETVDGSPAVVRFRRAEILPPVGVRGKVSGKGVKRTLSYEILGRAGQEVRFLEVVKGNQKTLKVVRRGGKGTVRFAVSEGKSTTRRIYAEVTQNGIPRKRQAIARFTAANAKVGKVGKLKVRRRGSRAVVTWTKPALAGTIYVHARYGGGDTVYQRLPAKARRLVLPGVRRGEGVVVKVRNVSPSSRSGKLATARLKGSMRFGAVKKAAKYDPAKARALKKKLAARARARARKRR